MRSWLPTRAALPGLALSIGVALLALLAGTIVQRVTPHLSDLIIAMVLGALISNTAIRRWVRLERESATCIQEPGLRYVGNHLLKISIILSGLRVRDNFLQLRFFREAALIIIVALPVAYLAAQIASRLLRLRESMGDLLSIGTMVCGASAINALSPIVDAKKTEQGLAVTAVSVFSLFALVVFYPVGRVLGLPDEFAGLWSGLAVNDLSSSVAVGNQFSTAAGNVAMASKSLRILLLGPVLVGFSVLRGWRRRETKAISMRGLVPYLPLFLVGFLACSTLRVLGDATFRSSPFWLGALGVGDLTSRLSILTACAAIGMQIDGHAIRAVGWKALAAGGVASVSMAGVSLWMVYAFARERPALALVVGMFVLVSAAALYRLAGPTPRSQGASSSPTAGPVAALAIEKR